MGTYKEESQEQEAHQGPKVEENFITGPPASRTVIDNLKKLLVQRQHSRESDYENKNAVTQSTSGSNSDAAFYSQFSTSSSESDSDSDSYLIFEDISNQENRKGSGRRRSHRRQRSYSSSSSSSRSPVEKRRRKPTSKSKIALTGSDDNARQPPSSELSKESLCSTQPASKQEADSANSTSSHKDSSSEEENHGIQQRLDESERLPKFRSRRDRNRKRKRSETNYATNRPTTTIPTIVISHTDNDVNIIETDTTTKNTAVAIMTTSICSALDTTTAGSEQRAEESTGEGVRNDDDQTALQDQIQNQPDDKPTV